MQEHQAVDGEPGDEYGADDESRGAHHSEEPQRLLREAHEEEDRENVENPVGVLAHRVTAVVAVVRRLRNIDFDAAEALPPCEHREKSMLVPVQGNFLEHAPLHGANAAAEVIEMLSSGSDQLVEDITPQHLEAASAPWPPAPDGDIRLVERSHQLGDLGAMNLVVGQRRHDHSARHTLKTNQKRRDNTKTLGETDDDEIL